ncbi:MAG: hypothetical protein U0840_04480 [Gemmataceae bacterium]
MPRAVWQREILRAFQTWAVRTNINFALTSDAGLPFGTSGLIQGDGRFGDIRIGAQPMSGEALAVSVPQDPALAGTWSGDVFLNSRVRFTPANLYPIMLHEVGHVLGFSNSTDPKSPMFSRLGGSKPLTAGDLTRLQALYGTRSADSWEGTQGNDQFGTATDVNAAVGGSARNGSEPWVVFGDMGSTSDVDTYRVKMLPGYSGSVTFRLQSAGLSLLAPSLSLVNASGVQVGSQISPVAALGRGSILTIRLAHVAPESTFYLRVKGASANQFSLGRYGLSVLYEDLLTTTAGTVGSVLRQTPSAVTTYQDDHLFENLVGALFSEDSGSDDDCNGIGASEVEGEGNDASYVLGGSIESPTDADCFRLEAPERANDATLALIIRVTTTRINGLIPHLEVLDRDLNPLASQILVNGDGVLAIQVIGLESGRKFFLRFTSPEGDTGNYQVRAQFRDTPFSPQAFVLGQQGPVQPSSSYRLFVGQTQLMQFTLATEAVNAGTTGRVRFELRNSAGRVVVNLVANAGETLTAPTLFLSPGFYSATFTIEPVNGGSLVELQYRLTGATLSDPIGPALGNPTLRPQYTNPLDPTQFLYPGQVNWQDPYFWILIDPSGYLVIPGTTTTPTVNAYALNNGVVIPTAP